MQTYTFKNLLTEKELAINPTMRPIKISKKLKNRDKLGIMGIKEMLLCIHDAKKLYVRDKIITAIKDPAKP